MVKIGRPKLFTAEEARLRKNERTLHLRCTHPAHLKDMAGNVVRASASIYSTIFGPLYLLGAYERGGR